MKQKTLTYYDGNDLLGEQDDGSNLGNSNRFTWGDCELSLVYADDLLEEIIEMGYIEGEMPTFTQRLRLIAMNNPKALISLPS